MDKEEVTVPGGQPYSGRNRIPNIKQFMENLDRDKRERDAKIDTLRKQEGHPRVDAQEHHNFTGPAGKNRRTTRDPVTGKEVEVDDVDSSHVKAAQNPKVRMELWIISPEDSRALPLSFSLLLFLFSFLFLFGLGRELFVLTHCYFSSPCQMPTLERRQPSRRNTHSREKNTGKTRISQRHPTPSRRAPPATYPSTVRRPMCFSILCRPSATSPCTRPSRRKH